MKRNLLSNNCTTLKYQQTMQSAFSDSLMALTPVKCQEPVQLYGGIFECVLIFQGFRGILFSRGNFLVCVLVRTLQGSADLVGVVRTWWG